MDPLDLFSCRVQEKCIKNETEKAYFADMDSDKKCLDSSLERLDPLSFVKEENIDDVQVTFKQDNVDDMDTNPLTQLSSRVKEEQVDDESEQGSFADVDMDTKYLDSEPADDPLSCMKEEHIVDVQDGSEQNPLEVSNGEEEMEELSATVVTPNEDAPFTFQSGNESSHRNKHEGARRRDIPFICNQCDYRSSTNRNLTVHMRAHKGAKPFSCGQCKYRTLRKANLTSHIRTHTGVKPFICSQCDFKSSQKTNLILHIRNHTGDKPFACSQCDFKTTQKAHLTVHIRKHTGDKPFVCSQCDFKTSQKAHLTVHIRKHTGDKPFVCSQCDYKTSCNGDLKVHMKTHTGDKPFVCGQCDYKTSRNGDLKVHMRTHTGY